MRSEIQLLNKKARAETTTVENTPEKKTVVMEKFISE